MGDTGCQGGISVVAEQGRALREFRVGEHRSLAAREELQAADVLCMSQMRRQRGDEGKGEERDPLKADVLIAPAEAPLHHLPTRLILEVFHTVATTADLGTRSKWAAFSIIRS